MSAVPRVSTAQAYYHITKPGIIYGNCISAAAGFLLAAGTQIDWLRLLATLAGTGFIIAAGCVLNNVLDRDIDSKMERTKNRALVEGTISTRNALVYAAALSLGGFAILSLYTNILAVYTGLAGLYFYVIAYGVWKRRSPVGTIVGSVAGSAPIVAGYVAASGRLDLGALVLFITMAVWQMPHFYAIAMYRLNDYKAAGLPVLPAVKGLAHTRLRLVQYVAGFAAACICLTLAGITGMTFLVVMLGLSAVWLYKGLDSSKAGDLTAWARQMFGFSLVVMVSLSAMLALEAWLP